jgi:hypothetical protein
LWIPAHRDCGRIREDGDEVFFDLHLVDQVVQEVRRPPELRERVGEGVKSAETLLSPGGGHRKVIAGSVPLVRT